MPKDKGERGACEWRSGKVRARSRCAEITERLNEKHEADTIAKKADTRHTKGHVYARNFRADRESESAIDDPRHQSLPHRNLRWVAAGNFAGEIVVNAPTEAGRGNEERTVRDRHALFLWQREENAPEKNASKAGANAPVHALAKKNPGDERCRDGFQVKKQRGRTC